MNRHAIRAIESIIVDLPLVRLQRFAAMGVHKQSLVIIRVATESGFEGIGEAVTPSGPWWGGESVETIKTIVDQYLTPELIGGDPFAIEAISQKLATRVFGNTFAKAGLEMALFDLQGKILDLPLHVLLGGKRRDALSCAWPLATGDADLEIEEAEAKLAAGHHNSFKLKMGALDPEADVIRACRIARAFEGRASVRSDPNERWDELTAKRAIAAMEDAGIAIVEQPLVRANLKASARLTERSRCAIMADEGVATASDMLRCVELHAADIVSLKLMKHGGIGPARRISHIAEAGGIALYMGTFLESSIGTAANMQFAATLAHLPHGGELSGPGLLAEDIAQVPAVYRDCKLQMGDGVGIGATIDESRLARFRRDRVVSAHPIRKLEALSADGVAT